MIRLVEDVGAPALVFAADYGTSKIDEKAAAGATKWNRPIGIGLATAGYLLGGWLGFGGNFVKNLGIASFDWAANSISSYITETSAPVTARVSRPVSRVSGRVSGYPQQPANGAGLWPRAV